jgi:multidrug resistance efflux pump
MSESAHVTSLDALRELREKLIAFGVDAQEALAAAEQEIRRTEEWLQQQLKHWLRVVRELQEEVARAKAALVQRRWGHTEGRGPGTTEQEIAVKKAQERLREAEAKVETVRRWIHQLPREVNEYQGPARRLAGFVEADLRNAAVLLEKKIVSLEAYAALTAPPALAAAPPEAPPTP